MNGKVKQGREGRKYGRIKIGRQGEKEEWKGSGKRDEMMEEIMTWDKNGSKRKKK